MSSQTVQKNLVHGSNVAYMNIDGPVRNRMLQQHSLRCILCLTSEVRRGQPPARAYQIIAWRHAGSYLQRAGRAVLAASFIRGKLRVVFQDHMQMNFSLW